MTDVLKALFSSMTRVKLLSVFLLHHDEEYFIRELTRLLSEQINSIRRELENLKRIGLVKSRHKHRKKFYRINPEFPLLQDLSSLFSKAITGEPPIITELKRVPGLRLLILSGVFVGEEDKIDLLAVGDIQKQQLESILGKDPHLKNVKYSIFSKSDFLYRLHLRDKFILEILNHPNHIHAMNTMAKEIEEAKTV